MNDAEYQALLAKGYEEHSGVLVGPRCPAEIAKLISLARPVQLSARQSGAPTGRVYRNVARDGLQAADELLQKLDIYVKHLMPSESVVVDALTTTTNRGTYRELGSGKEFRCAFASVDLRARGCALYITLAVGPSTKLSAADRHSPVVVNLADDVAKVRPGLVFGKRGDRLMRQGWAQAPFWAELEVIAQRDSAPFVADGEEVWGLDPLGQAFRLLKGAGDRAQGLATAKKTRDSMLTYTGEKVEMRDGHFDWYMASYPPPGLARIRVVGKHATGSISRLYLDSPSNYPDLSTAQSPIPCPRDHAGRPVDQVENLRWYLAHAGKPGWTVSDLGREMIRRGYATDATRRNGPAATYLPGQEYTLQETIWANLNMFETGKFERPMQNKLVKVSGVWPLDGRPWASAEDFARIRHWRQELVSLYAAQTKYTFSGIRGTIDGRPFTFVARPSPNHLSPREVAIDYAFEKPKRSQHATKSEYTPRQRAYLLHQWIAEAILRAFRRAQTVPVPLAIAEADEAQLTHLNGRIQEALQTLDDAKRERRLLLQDVEERVPGTDEHVMTAKQRQQSRTRVDDLEERLPALEDQLAERERDLNEYMERLTQAQRGVEAHLLAELFVSLLNPFDVSYRHTWQMAIRDFEATTAAVRRAGSVGTEIRFAFTLLFSDGDTTVAIPASGRHDLGSLARRPHEAKTMMEALRAGTPLDWEENGNGLTQRKIFRYLREEVLRLTDGRSAFMQCRVPDLLRLGMSTLFPQEDSATGMVGSEPVEDAALEKVFTRPDLLAKRISRIYPTLSLRNGWLVRTSAVEVHALVVAAQNGGAVRRSDFDTSTAWTNFQWLLADNGRSEDADRLTEWSSVSATEYRLSPCPNCGSVHRALMGFREATGYVCLRCRSDSAGVTWPAKMFDPYVREPALWNALGYTLPVATDEHYVGRRWQQRSAGAIAPTASRPGQVSRAVSARRRYRRRPLAELSKQELAEAVGEYTSGKPLREVTARYNIRQNELSRHLLDAGLLRLRATSARKPS